MRVRYVFEIGDSTSLALHLQGRLGGLGALDLVCRSLSAAKLLQRAFGGRGFFRLGHFRGGDDGGDYRLSWLSDFVDLLHATVDRRLQGQQIGAGD